jgi:hypothetical protein
MPVMTGWKVYDNSAEGQPLLIAKGKHEQPEVVFEPECWSWIRRSALNA